MVCIIKATNIKLMFKRILVVPFINPELLLPGFLLSNRIPFLNYRHRFLLIPHIIQWLCISRIIFVRIPVIIVKHFWNMRHFHRGAADWLSVCWVVVVWFEGAGVGALLNKCPIFAIIKFIFSFIPFIRMLLNIRQIKVYCWLSFVNWHFITVNRMVLVLW